MMATSGIVVSNLALSPSASGSGGGQPNPANLVSGASPDPLIATIRELHKQRQDILRAEVRLTNQIEAVTRRITGMVKEQREKELRRLNKATRAGQKADGSHFCDACPDAIEIGEGLGCRDTHSIGVLADLPSNLAKAERASMPLVNARAVLQAERKPIEKSLEKLAKQLPVWAWAEGVRGFGAGSLAAIVGECGDLNGYANPAKVWKRMGLAVINGERQRKVAGAEAIEHGYNPQRRAIMWNVGECLVKQNDGEFRAYYDAEKVRIAELHPDFAPVLANNRAKRHMTKRLLRELWREWRAPANA